MNEYLVVDIGVDVSKTGDYLVAAVLESTSGQYIDLANASTTSVSGSQALSLRFSGNAIREVGLDGPYVVTQVRLIDESDMIKVDEANDVWVTAAYDHAQFGNLRTYIPIIVKNR